MFPTGIPGLALLLLRGSVAIALAAEVHANRHDLPAWLTVAAISIALALAAGGVTPIAAALALAAHALLWLDVGMGSPLGAAVVALDAIALAFLGPGAYSFDSYRFGRRVVVLPPA